MPESVADKTPMPITIRRRHIDPPGLWIAIVIGSVVLHSLVLWLMFTSKLNIVGRRSNAATPIKIVEVVPTIKAKAKPRIIAQKPKVQPKLQPKPIQVKPEIKTQPIPAQPPQNRTSQPGTIAFTDRIPVKKPVNKSPLVQKQRSLPPIKPKLEPKVSIIPKKPVKTEPKKPNIAEIRRLQRLAEQQRQQELAEQRRFDKLVQQQRQQELAEQRRFDKLVQQQRQQELAEQRRLQKLAQQQRQQELAEQLRFDKLVQQQRQQELAEQQRLQKLAQQQIDAQRRTEDVARNQAKLPVNTAPVEISGNPDTPFSRPTPITTPTEAAAPRPTVKPRPTQKPTTTADSTSVQGGFILVNLLPVDEEAQKGLNAGTTRLVVNPKLQETTNTPKKLPVLNEQDKKLVTQPIKCGVLLSIDASGNIFSPREGFPGIKASSDVPGTGDLCQRYVDEYFKLNKENIRISPGRDIDGIPSAGQLFRHITIQPAAPENKNPS